MPDESTLPMEIAVVVPTLNERENIAALIDGILAADARLQIIVVDDGSRDGTAHYVAQRRTAGETRLHLIERGRKLGYASAIQDGMRFALQHEAARIITMDADFSHHPKYLPALLKKSERFDLMIGSRYVRGGGTRNWGIYRKVLSGGANWLARTLLGLPARDCTAGFRCWKRELIERARILEVRVEGYAFLFLTLDNCRRVRASIGEIPIIFVDRQFGHSKMSRRIVLEAVKVLCGLWWKRWRG
jgi:dolichol-phosphate mannosyltransferase